MAWAGAGGVGMDRVLEVGALSLGGVLGVNARFFLGLLINRWAGPQFPWATFAINVSGSFLIGFLTVVLARWAPHPSVRLLTVTGFLGGYTTFSTFAFESLTLWERGERGRTFAYVAGSVAAGLLAVVAGAALARGLTVPRAERTEPAVAADDARAGGAANARAAGEAT